MKVIFMGSPDFAVPALEGIINSRHEVCAVVTQQDKPKGRGHTLAPTPVKACAESHGIPVYTPKTLKNGELLPLLEEIKPDIIVVVAYGKILPDYVLTGAKYGCINGHASLLPRWRGAAPMQRCIMEGDKRYGMTVIQLEDGIDTGDMFLKKAFPLDIDDDLETVHDTLANAAPALLLEVMEQLENGTATPQKQNDLFATYAEKLTKADEKIDFSNFAFEVHDQIRALSPFPLCFTHVGNKLLKVIKTTLTDTKTTAPAGTVTSLDGGIHVACADCEIIITQVLPEGKKRMNAEDFIRGRGIAVGDILK